VGEIRNTCRVLIGKRRRNTIKNKVKSKVIPIQAVEALRVAGG
jgi:hypothetical protein